LKLSVNKPVLKADDHRLETIRVTAAATDAESGIASVILRSITSSDPDDGIGDGVTGGDIQGAEFGTADFEFQLRAERSGVKTSRVYTITYRATDLAGNWTDVSTTVTVPR
jgi:pectinesterase